MADGYVAGRGYTVDAYFRLVDDGVLRREDRVELLDGVIVAEPPMDPPHATGVTLVGTALTRAVGDWAVVRVQSPLLADPLSAPEPDVAVVAGCAADYLKRHPSTALLVVEVAASSLPQDRLSKSRIYAGARVAEYWILNLRDDCIEVFRTPDPERRVYGERAIARRGDRLRVAGLEDVSVVVDDLLPTP